MSGVLPRAYAKVVGSVFAVTSDQRGGWYVGGAFTEVGGLRRHNLAHVLPNGDVAPWAPEPDGIVWALAFNDGVVYAGGGFLTIGGQVRSLVAAIDARTGKATRWNAHADATDPEQFGPRVRALAVHERTLYVGGYFTQMGGSARGNLAALDLQTGDATSWDPSILGEVRAMAIDGRVVYAGGSFVQVGGLRRNGLAAIDVSTGDPTAWDLAPIRPVFPWYTDPPIVSALALRGELLFAAGCFEVIGGQVRHGLASISTLTGALTPWVPDPTGGTPYTYLNALVLIGNEVVVAGNFSNVGGQARGYLAALDAETGMATAWNPHPNSEVKALAALGETVYAGGYFTMMGKWYPRSCLAALDATTGELRDWNFHLAGYQVNAIAVRGAIIYVGGDFSELGGYTRSYLAAFDSETADPVAWAPHPDGPIWTMAASDSTLYVGGVFLHVGGEERHRIAALQLVDASATAWNPSADDAVATLAVDGSTVYAGGLFGRIAGQTRSRIAALDRATGAATAWDPAAHSWGWVNSIALGRTAVYVGGLFMSIGGALRSNLAAVDITTGAAVEWNPGADGEVETVAVSDSTVFAGGFFRVVSGQSRRGLVALDARTATVFGWDPIPDSNIWALSPSDGRLYVGGDFSSVQGLPQLNVAAIAMPVPDSGPGCTSMSAVSPRASLEHIAPNPVGGDAVLHFHVRVPMKINLTIFDVQGRRMLTIEDREARSAGDYNIPINTAGWPAGTYFCRLRDSRYAESRMFVHIE